jgi:CTP:molybdopterin cytidylyltransferase MocA
MTPGLHVVLLAAGSSARFGSPKQLAEVDGQPMLVRALRTLLELDVRAPITVVLGANADRLRPLLDQPAVNVVVNPNHEQGMAGSILAGVSAAPAAARGVLIALVDQVAVTTDDLRRLVTCWQQQPERIVAARYADVAGAPAIFPRGFFAQLAALQGDQGARALLARHADQVVGVPMPSAALDVDTPADLNRI